MNAITANPASDYIEKVLGQVTSHLNINSDVAPIKTFSHQAFGELGYLKVLDANSHPELLKILHLRLNFAPVGMEANAMQIITRPDSLAPHCMIECIFHDPSVETPFRPAHDGPAEFGFFLQLVSKVDPGINLQYLQHVFQPLEAINTEIRADNAIRFAAIPRMQLATMQPWVMAVTVPHTKFKTMQQVCQHYIDRALAIIDNGIPNGIVSAQEAERSAMRDAINRATYLSPEVDQIWQRMARIIGEEDAERIREIMCSQDIETVF